jgi:hypothetical protein
MSADAAFLLDLWDDQPGEYFFVCGRVRPGPSAWREISIAREDLPRDLPEALASLGGDVYFCPHGFTHGQRKKAYAAPSRWLWADIDAVPLREVRPKPTVLIMSSPGRYQGLWRMSVPSQGEHVAALNKRLTRAIGADPSGCDLTQVLRLPGTVNLKYDPAPEVQLLWSEDETFDAEALDVTLPKLPEPRRAATPSAGNGRAAGVGDWTSLTPRQLAQRYRISSYPFTKVPHVEGERRRSRAVWNVYWRMICAGASLDECLYVLEACPPWQERCDEEPASRDREVRKMESLIAERDESATDLSQR